MGVCPEAADLVGWLSMATYWFDAEANDISTDGAGVTDATSETPGVACGS